ncbi:uncharacterized protein F5Z01DRAFT_316007 [Emericellopsis atlantica]|uniref:LysM domain-containing protein n=1 Tax=Emericellopsis atlantica TaxID=2614577 RepID=A0A9P8CSP8_9HYPO|nr:uncharacterized protein F5Z01DRAFT_316007 [Emericellopsis atlantica]KAG9258058.1 hypothetical protein F5Z01DRAFT_316007 [Emericellopsis atlantica]
MTESCRQFYMQQEGEFCYDMAVKNGVSLDDFYAWNPAVGDGCANMWPGYYYCVGVSGPAATMDRRSDAIPTL